MQDLRIILIIIGAIAIAALLIHGLWTSQKGRQKPIREKPMNKVATQTADGKGFDEDGIGKVRVVQQPRRRLDDDEDNIPVAAPNVSAYDSEDEEDEPHLGLSTPPAAQAKPKSAEIERQHRYEQGEIDPLFDEPEAEPAVVTETANAAQAAPAAARGMEPTVTPRPKTWQDVYVVNLMARPNQRLQGRTLMQVLTALGFKFGDMDIFHRHQSPSGQGEVMFSLINMVKPGTFDPNAMADFTTPGISIFMQLPEPGLGKVHFNLMIQAAETLAEELDGLLFDGERSPLSPDYLAHCREQLRDYDNQLN
ncbi:cell division protein ZipA [Zobellella maritima]|uniref:cell division protein ZipA n=1 Tax=Zobellella maritima TaxID=2059725 RepID=UPI000E30808F|nr:cell division protein ZipA [Zobellella maritima]